MPAQKAVVKELKAEDPKVRYVKMQTTFRDKEDSLLDPEPTRVLPRLTLKGNWLEAAGFVPNEYVSITSMEGLLIIRVCAH